MTISAADIALYCFALFVLFLTPGPVWLALTARTLSGGFASGFPLAMGVVIGDALWPFLAILGVTWVVSTFSGFMLALQWVAVVMFVTMGVMLIRHADRKIDADSRLTRPGAWAGFLAGVAVILSNPKAILFYMGVLPGFFDLTRLSAADIAVVVTASMLVPLIGNTFFALFVDRLRGYLTTSTAMARTNRIAGALLIGVGGLIALS